MFLLSLNIKEEKSSTWCGYIKILILLASPSLNALSKLNNNFPDGKIKLVNFLLIMFGNQIQEYFDQKYPNKCLLYVFNLIS